jgi:hypothetical protein
MFRGGLGTVEYFEKQCALAAERYRDAIALSARGRRSV